MYSRWQPFTALNDLRSAVKDGRFAVAAPPPASNADRMSVRELCARIPLDPAEAAANARARGLAISDASKTNPNYNWDDVLPNLRASTSWSGVPFAPLGGDGA